MPTRASTSLSSYADHSSGAPTGSGKTVAAELSIFHMLRNQPGSKAVYVAPLKALVRERMTDWSKRLSPKLGLKFVLHIVWFQMTTMCDALM